MKHRITGIICLLLTVAVLCGDDLQDNQKKLDKVQKDLQAAQKKIEQNERNKRKNENEISNSRRAKQKTDAEMRRSQEVAREKLQALNSVRTELRTVEEQIRDLRTAQISQLDKMVRLSRRNKTLKMVHKDEHCLAILASKTRNKLITLGDAQSELSYEQSQKGQEYSLANSDFQNKSSTSKNLAANVKKLEAQQSRLSREQKNLQNQIARLQQDAARLEGLIASLASKPRSDDQEPASYKFSSRTIAWPLKGRIIRSYGQESRAYGTSVVSNGIDIAAPEYTTVAAADAGVVVFSGSYGGQGKLLIIDHKNGFFTVYAYNNDLLVSTGTNVKKGQAVAKSGMTGSASEPSLHFEVRKDGKAVNPLLYLE
ncbi:MAG: peptidoglycan DD-metalloendopeptidase family protein [Candidatus Cloacimonetes bacterium]|nr:peptidoglycan DD-metalloendopeptidase family protein [Candidatus Cloacimonadota bacterium]